MDYDVVVIGAGVVGLACLADLSGKGYHSLMLERNERIGMETSSRNSEVIHAGMYYPKGSLKAQLCLEGNKMLYDFCLLNNIPHSRIGKYIIAPSADDLPALEAIYRRARENGVNGLQRADIDEMRSIEPNVKYVAALFSADTGIIDSHSFMECLKFKSEQNNADFALKHTVTAIESIAGGYLVTVELPDSRQFTISTARIVNSAGLQSDIIAELAGIDIDQANYRLKYCKGHYFRIAPAKSNIANHLIYPAVNPAGMTGIGIHITKELSGGAKLGPDTLYLSDRETDYSIDESYKNKFYTAASKYLEGLKIEDISPDQTGIRPKLQGKGENVRDFVIAEESSKGLPNFVNLIGIESPGLTASLAIADKVSKMI